MTDEERENPSENPTSPPADHPGEATSPPGNGDVDEAAVEQGQEKLDQAGGGH